MDGTNTNATRAATCANCFFHFAATTRARNGKPRTCTYCGIRPPTSSGRFPETFDCARCTYWTNADTQAQPFHYLAPPYPPMMAYPMQTDRGARHGV